MYGISKEQNEGAFSPGIWCVSKFNTNDMVDLHLQCFFTCYFCVSKQNN